VIPDTPVKIASKINDLKKENQKANGPLRQPGSSGGDGVALKPHETKIGSYILGRTIGEGTFGKVKIGKHIVTETKVAVKILEKSKIADIADYERVSREIDYIVKRQRVPEKEACRFFQQLISGIEYLSRLNIVHRDLKPENLLIDFDKGIKIVDFGLSNTYKDGELLKTACGSPCYAAPEMIAGKKYHGTNVDIWSCGVILFALICGYLPFEDPNTSNLYKKILSADFQTPHFVSDEAKDLFHKILNTDPKKRFKIEEIRAHPWFNLVPCEFTFKGVKAGFDPVPIDPQVVQQMQA
jgi:5'-AMP-activated protein kinase catalytic alpha subunit